MEVKGNAPAWLDESHPNYKRWERARNLSLERGDFVRSVVQLHSSCSRLTVLDLGSGEGGTAKTFSENNFVVSFDVSITRLERQKESGAEYCLVNGDALRIPFAGKKFDLIIIQDVLEHLSDIHLFISNVKDVLKDSGIIYLSTPNKHSIINFLSDPHWGMPVLSMLKRNSIKKYFLKIFRRSDYPRKDIAQLLSLYDLNKFFNRDFEISIHTRHAVKKLFEGHKGIIWSEFHLRVLHLLKLLKIKNAMIKLSNDRPGLINKFFTPSFYLILKRIN